MSRKPRSLADQAGWELRKIGRLIRMARRRGDLNICQQLLNHADKIRVFIDQRKYSQALHTARFRMMG